MNWKVLSTSFVVVGVLTAAAFYLGLLRKTGDGASGTADLDDEPFGIQVPAANSESPAETNATLSPDPSDGLSGDSEDVVADGATTESQEATSQVDHSGKIGQIETLCKSFAYSELQYSDSVANFFERMRRGYAEETPEADFISELWRQRRFDQVMAYAEKRLDANPRDLAGHLLKQDWAMVSVDLDSYFESSIAVLECLAEVDGEEFLALQPTIVMQIEKSLPAIMARTPDAVPGFQESARMRIENPDLPPPPLSVLLHLQALELDGYLAPLEEND